MGQSQSQTPYLTADDIKSYETECEEMRITYLTCKVAGHIDKYMTKSPSEIKWDNHNDEMCVLSDNFDIDKKCVNMPGYKASVCFRIMPTRHPWNILECPTQTCPAIKCRVKLYGDNQNYSYENDISMRVNNALIKSFANKNINTVFKNKANTTDIEHTLIIPFPSKNK